MRKVYRITYRMIAADGSLSASMTMVIQAHSPNEARQVFQFRYPRERYQLDAVSGA
ncbi:MAG: hypothetical protein FJY99_11405 [Candidatus Sericytochromatia bacterium]|nr:hypothetical protein [Candidatus Tanganyikabacteria bacterium]